MPSLPLLQHRQSAFMDDNIICIGSFELFTITNTLRPVSWLLTGIHEMLIILNEMLASLGYVVIIYI